MNWRNWERGRTGQTGSDRSDGFFFRRRGGHGAPGIAVKRVAEPTLELSGPVALPDGAGTAFYFLRGQHAAKLGRNGRERKSVSIFEGGIRFRTGQTGSDGSDGGIWGRLLLHAEGMYRWGEKQKALG